MNKTDHNDTKNEKLETETQLNTREKNLSGSVLVKSNKKIKGNSKDNGKNILEINHELKNDPNYFCKFNCVANKENTISSSDKSKGNIIVCKNKESNDYLKKIFCGSICITDNDKNDCYYRR